MKRSALHLLVLCISGALYGQVTLDVGIRFTGADSAARITGLATPITGTSAISVSVFASGFAHWATANMQGAVLQLTIAPAVDVLNQGLLLRTLVPADNTGPLSVSLAGQSTLPLLRTTGEPLPPSALRSGAVAELLFSGDAWLLLNPSTTTCPTGTLHTSGHVCMDSTSIQGLRFYQAVEHCAARGGKLCSWDEYATGCALLQSQLSGLFNEWEWIDDASNHTHSANQAGRFTCQSQRSANALTLITGDTRCCFKTR